MLPAFQLFEIVFSAAHTGDAGTFSASVSTTNGLGVVEQPLPIAPRFFEGDMTVGSGGNATLGVYVTGPLPHVWQWFWNTRGDERFPIPGGRVPRVVTPPLTVNTAAWVRVTSPRFTNVFELEAQLLIATNRDGAFEGELNPQHDTWNRMTTNGVFSGQQVRYDTVRYQIQQHGVYRVQITSPDFNPALNIYANFFNPGLPQQNFWTDGVVSTSNVATLDTFHTRGTYELVISTATTGQTGRFSGALNGGPAPALLLPPFPPSIAFNPVDTTVRPGSSATLNVGALGRSPRSYQWYHGFTGNTNAPVAGATNTTLVTGPISTNTSFWVRVSNPDGVADSASATVFVMDGPVEFHGELTPCDPTFNRPVAAGVLGGTNVPFRVFRFLVAQTAEYTFTVETDGFTPAAAAYGSIFIPSNPLLNQARPHAGVGNTLSFTERLLASPLPYNFVVTTPQALGFGEFTLRVLSDAFTIEGWVNIRTHRDWARFADFGNGPASDNIACLLSHGASRRPALELRTPNGVATLIAPAPLPANQWVHLAFVLERLGFPNQARAAIYVNGTLATNDIVYPPAAVARARSYFGRSNVPADPLAHAAFDELRVWTEARSPEQIRQGITQPVATNAPNLFAWLRANETDAVLFNEAAPTSRAAFVDVVTAPGRFGNAFTLPGDGQHIDLPDGAWATGELTLEAWVFVRRNATWARLMEFGNGPEQHNVVLGLSDGASGRPFFSVRNGAQASTVTAPNALPLNQWVHLAANLFDNGFGQLTGRLIVNGAQQASRANFTRPANVTRTNNFIGRSNYPNDGFADFLVDEMRIWNTGRALSQIQATANAPLTGAEAGLVEVFPFETTLVPYGFAGRRGTQATVSPRVARVPGPAGQLMFDQSAVAADSPDDADLAGGTFTATLLNPAPGDALFLAPLPTDSEPIALNADRVLWRGLFLGNVTTDASGTGLSVQLNASANAAAIAALVRAVQFHNATSRPDPTPRVVRFAGTEADGAVADPTDVTIWIRPDRDGDRLPDDLDACPDSPPGVVVDVLGCTPGAVRDCKIDSSVAQTSFGPEGGVQGFFSVTTSDPGCTWTAGADVPWITIPFHRSGTGNLLAGTFVLEENLTPVARTGRLYIAEQAHTITQSAMHYPVLFFQVSGTNLVLSWPTESGPLPVLQQTDNLASPDWRDAPTGTSQPAVVPLTAPMKFFRLRQ
jgi:hypothetical protein